MMPNIVGLVGIALAMIGMSDLTYLPFVLRLIVLLASSVCLPVSFFARREWPLWIRWCLSFATNSFLVQVACFYFSKSDMMLR